MRWFRMQWFRIQGFGIHWFRVFLLLLSGSCVGGCVDSESERAASREAAYIGSEDLQGYLRDEAVGSADALVFRLAFDTTVDLDLYVTDPLLETVYFANHQTQSGGRIVADVRCSSAGDSVRIEEIRFEDPYPGRYRVGVDFPRHCGGEDRDGDDEFAGYAVSVNGAGASHSVRGSIERQQFEVVVLEFDLEG